MVCTCVCPRSTTHGAYVHVHQKYNLWCDVHMHQKYNIWCVRAWAWACVWMWVCMCMFCVCFYVRACVRSVCMCVCVCARLCVLVCLCLTLYPPISFPLLPPLPSPRTGLHRLDRPLYLLFWQRLLSSGVRTTNGEEADYYFIPIKMRMGYDG